jgi:hypothetical protein
MDLAFLLRAERMLDRRSESGIDYGVLVATLAAHQAASVTGRAAALRAQRHRAFGRRNEALVELLTAGPAWREAGRTLGGSFNRKIAGAASISRQRMSPARLPSHFSLPSMLRGYSDCGETRLPRGARDL